MDINSVNQTVDQSGISSSQSPIPDQRTPQKTPPKADRPLADFFPAKIVVIILGVILIAVVGAGTYYLAVNQKQTVTQPVQQTTISSSPIPTFDPTANWKVFTNSQANVSFKYPDNWYFQDVSKFGGATEGSTYGFYMNGVKADPSSGDHKGNEVFIFNSTKGKYSIDDLKKGLTNSQEVKIGDNSAIRTDSTVEILTDSGIIHLGFVSQEAKNSIDAILSTFKFLDQDQAGGTANWKAYINTKFAYSINYPADWFIRSPKGGKLGDQCQEATNQSEIVEIAQHFINDCGFVGENLPSNEVDITIWSQAKPWDNIYNILGSSEKITISNEPAAKYIFTEKSALPNIQATRIYLNHAGKSFLIFIKQKDKLGNYDPLLGQILSTFKFTN